ncbi:MAG: Smr/MutS family protein [Chitinophagales bacterium]|nr:Smr/MutS family protein [Chitinophagales bacterium]MDW8274461.1 Smr/MutS family protein [Chitinophagales bacterium]
MMGAANPLQSDKFSRNIPDTVDLHFEVTCKSKDTPDATEILLLQLQEVEKCIDAAVAAGKTELRIVHGIGKGKLKEEIHKMLKKHPLVCSFENDYSPRYGWGSTIIRFF